MTANDSDFGGDEEKTLPPAPREEPSAGLAGSAGDFRTYGRRPSRASRRPGFSKSDWCQTVELLPTSLSMSRWLAISRASSSVSSRNPITVVLS